jgi:hypothetical protein
MLFLYNKTATFLMLFIVQRNPYIYTANFHVSIYFNNCLGISSFDSQQ